MPDQKISVDPAAADLSGCIIPVVTGGINKQAANSLFGITGVANGVIYSAGNRNTSDPTNFNYVPGTQTLTVVGPIRTSPVTNEATVATPANGMIIYSTALSKFRAYENGAWVNLIGGAGGGWPFTGTGTFTGAVTIDQTTTAGNILKFLTPNLGVTSINGKGIWIQNATAAAVGAQQISGGVLWEGQGWATTPVQTQPVQYMADLLPVQGAANPTGIWRLRSSINGAAYVKVVDFNGTSNGVTMQLYDNGSNVSTLSTQYFGFGTGFAIIQNAGTFPMYIGNDGTGSVNIRVNASNRWGFGNAATSYSISPGADNTYDIGAQGANIPRNIYSYKSHIGGSSTPAASLEITQAILSASWQPALRIDPGAHTSLTAATEFKDYNFNTRTATWLAGTTATQRFAHFQGQTVAGASASATFTDLYTVFIDPSIVGSNAVVTNNWALGVGGNLKVQLDQNAGTYFYVLNATSGTAAYSGLLVGSSPANSTAFYSLSAGYTTSGILTSNTGVLYGGMPNGLNIGTGISTQLSFWTNNIKRQGIDANGLFTFIQSTQAVSNTFITFTQAIHTGGTPTGLLYTQGAHTGLTLSVESLAINLNTSATVQYATGAQAILRNILVQAPTIGFVGASTITDNATFTISGAPKAGTNTTQTNTHGLLIQAGAVTSAGSAFGLTVNAPTGGSSNYSAQFIGGNFQIIQSKQVIITPAVVTSGSPNGIIYTGAAHTTLTAGSEAIDIDFSFNRVVQFSTGALTNQRAMYLRAPSYAFVGASVITNAATLAIQGPPIGDANATITNAHSLLIEGGGAAHTTNSYGLTANANTGATNNYAAQFLGGNVGIGISAPVSALDVAGSLGTNTRTITASATLAATDHTVLCDSTGGVVAATLPTASGAKGRIYVVKKIDASANNVTLATVDGGTKTITTRYSGFAVQSDGSLWYVIASF